MSAEAAVTTGSRQSACISRATLCKSCGAPNLRAIYQARSIPAHSCVLLSTREEALRYPRRDLELAFCESCGFAFNSIFDPSVVEYSTDFEESQHFSETFSSFARALAREIRDKCDVAGKQVLEVGCGKGEFLAELCSISDARGVGIDPAFRADGGRLPKGDVHFIADYFGPKYADLIADVILCRHTLEHISEVASFIESIRQATDERASVYTVFETPDAKRILREGAFWDIYYEHCSYFSAGSHARLFRRGRFEVTDLRLAFFGQYIVQYACPAAAATAATFQVESDLAEMRLLASTFPKRVSDSIRRWSDQIAHLADHGQKIVLWGGGSKAVSFLAALNLADEIVAVVDVNPFKQNKFVPGSGHKIIGPSDLTSVRPDTVLVLNPVYVHEVAAKLGDLGLSADILAIQDKMPPAPRAAVRQTTDRQISF